MIASLITEPHRQSRMALLLISVAALVAATLAAVGVATPSRAAGTGPCDIYASGGTPCVAAHSTTRALYGNYSGSLYQVRRSSDNATLNIGPVSAGSYANAAAQDSFCSGTSCVITVIYDQSGRGNNLTQAPPGGFNGPASGGYDNLANATAAPISIGGHNVYGVYVSPGTGYRNNSTNGIATGDASEGMYAVFDGTHYNGGCCFDYGNAETNSRDDGNGTMEAIYFGNITVWGRGSGNGPWVMADLENGLFSGFNVGLNSADATRSDRFLTAIIKGGQNLWSIRAGNAQSGGLSTYYSGARPNTSGYNPMHKQGAIILGIGGDNSVGAAGTFYEGVMTSGYPSDATENSVQSNITAAGYSTSTTGGGGSSGYIKLQNRTSGLFLDNLGGTTNGSNVAQWAGSGSYNQQWLVVTSGGYVRLQDRATGLYLDGMGRTANGSNAGQWASSSSTNQQWTETISGGYAKFQNRATGLYLDNGGLTGNGSIVQQWPGGGSTNQQWVVSNA